jgi:hypothetical protein
MKNKAIYLLILLFAWTGCEKVLDKRDLNTLDETAWNNYSLSNMYLNEVYAENMPTFSLAQNSGYSDETYNDNDYIYGRLDENSVGTYSLFTYAKIRDINIMIEGVENGTLDEHDKELLDAQARFFRAWRYWELVNLYGGVPMVLTAQDPWHEELNVPRSKTSACIDLIVEDLDKGIEALPASWLDVENDYGRLTSVAAAAFKGRVLLFWASPQFNPNDLADRWQRAYDANLAAKNMLEAEGYGLLENFSQIFLMEGYANTEAIMIRSYDETYLPGRWESSCRPPSGGGTGSNNPTWGLVQAFPMSNGKRIADPGSGYNGIYYWQNRDPRFYATVAYNGCTWKMAGRSDTTQWTYFLNSQELSITPATGFYCRKGNNPQVQFEDVEKTPTDWIEIRFAEVLLNLAECANELDKRDEAYSILKQIRDRAGIEPGADNMYGLGAGMDKAAMREAIIWERQIELAFENKRYWDLRRRNMFAGDLGPNTPKLNGTVRRGLRIMAKPPHTAVEIDTIRNDIDINSADYANYFVAIPRVLDADYLINYEQPKYNFFAIPQNILDRSPSVEQTLGWANGTFDPLL